MTARNVKVFSRGSEFFSNCWLWALSRWKAHQYS